MPRFRRKPEVIDAEPWTPGDREQAKRLGIVEYERLDHRPGAWLPVGDRTVRFDLQPGQWIVTLPDGTRKVLTKVAIDAMYEPDDDHN